MRYASLTIILSALLSFSTISVGAEERAIEEIVVTATKRSESIQDVPIAVSAFTGEDLEARGVQDLYGLQEVAPSVAVYSSNSTSNGGTVRIRGVGTTGNNAGLEAAVGTFIDGVYRSRAGTAFNDLVDIERVEVLRGPQGTLFGKNTVAGALNILTKKPVFDTIGSLTLGAGNLDAQSAKGFFNFAVSDELAFRVAASYQERDGYYEVNDSSGSNDAYDGRDRYTVKAQALWQPSDQLSVRVIADYSDRDEDCCQAAYTVAGSASQLVEDLAADIGRTVPFFKKDSELDIGSNYAPFEEVENQGIMLEIDWALTEDITFKSITAVRDYEVFRGQDIDFGPADILLPQDTSSEIENFSQEFQFIGSTGDIDWLTGAYFYTEELGDTSFIMLASQGPLYVATLFGDPGAAGDFAGNPAGRVSSTGQIPNQGYDLANSSEADGWSVFTHNTWHMTDRAGLTLGLRYSYEEKDVKVIVNGAPVGQVVDDPLCGPWGAILVSFCDNQSFANKEDENELTGTLKFAYAFGDNINTYVSYSRGYKAGGYNLNQDSVGNRDANGNFIDGSRFDPEFSDSFEIGMKGTFFDSMLQLNTALFYTDFEDFQLNTFTGLFFTVGNLKEVTTEGFELEGLYQPNDIVGVSFGVTYADARYGEVVDVNLRDKTLTQSPLWQGSASLFFEDQVLSTDWRYNFTMNFSHVGEVNTGSNLAPEKVRRAFNTTNASLNVTSPDERWGIGIWGRNLGDVQRNQLVFDSVFQGTSRSTYGNIGRTYGVTLTVNLDAS